MKQKCAVLIGFLVVTFASVSVRADGWTKDDFVKLWNDVRHAISEGNLAKWTDLTVPSGESTENRPANQKDFAAVKDFMLDSIPDLKTSQFIKFDKNDKEAMFVLWRDVDDKNWITIDVFKFINSGNKWRLSGHVAGSSFSRKNSDGKDVDAAKAIEKEIQQNCEFHLSSEQANPPYSSPAGAGSKP